MKHIILLLTALAAALASQGQVLQVERVARVATPASPMAAEVAAVDPNGHYVLLTSPSQQGLTLLDLRSLQSRELTRAAGAGFGAKVSADGTLVAHQEVSTGAGHLLQRAVVVHDLTSGTATTALPATRELQGYDLQGGTLATVAGGQARLKALRGGSDGRGERPIVSNSNLKLQVTQHGVTRQFTPNGPELSYIWASLSPDGERVLYYVSELGCYSCRLDGSGMTSLGRLSAPQWLDDDTVVGMRESDDGVRITQSAIIAKTLDGVEQQLTASSMIAIYPHVAAQAGMIAFSTTEGDIYIIEFTKPSTPQP